MKHKNRSFKSRKKYLNSLKWLHSEIATRKKDLKYMIKHELDFYSLYDKTLTDIENLKNIEEIINAHKRL